MLSGKRLNSWASFSPCVIPFRTESRQRATGLWDKLVHNQQAVSAQLDQSATALQLLGWDHLTVLAEDGLPRRTGEKSHTDTDWNYISIIINSALYKHIGSYHAHRWSVPLLNVCPLNTNTDSHTQTGRRRGRHTKRQDETNPSTVNPLTSVDIPLTVWELKQLRRTTPGGTFDVYPLSLLGRWVVLPLKRAQNCVFILFL